MHYKDLLEAAARPMASVQLRTVALRALSAAAAIFLLVAWLHLLGGPLGGEVVPDAGSSAPPELLTAEVKPTPTPALEPVRIFDNFPLLATSTPPPIPSWNVAPKDVYKRPEYGALPVAPVLLIGFTRNWPLLLQCVVSYVTAGWPPEQIYVVENTGVQWANKRGQLSLENPLFFDYGAMAKLGVNVLRTPTLLSFAQLQNFYLHLSYEHDWPYYFWSHMDVVVLSFEDEDEDGHTLAFNQPSYKSLYIRALKALHDALSSERWGYRLFAYDMLTLMNRAAVEDVGGWDNLIPYYVTDCDMYGRLHMRNWTVVETRAGLIHDVKHPFNDLRVLYRVDGVEPGWGGPRAHNPAPENGSKDDTDDGKQQHRAEAKDGVAVRRRGKQEEEEEEEMERRQERDRSRTRASAYFNVQQELAKYRALVDSVRAMQDAKAGDGRLSWQRTQQGGAGEPFSYSPLGMHEGIHVLIEAGRHVYDLKWGKATCQDMPNRKYSDQWTYPIDE